MVRFLNAGRHGCHILVLLLVLIFSGCPSKKDSSTDSTGTGKTGALVVRTQWESKTQNRAVDCNSNHISTIEIKIYNSTNHLVSPGESFKCIDHKGSITNVPEGNYQVVLIARNENGHITYRGEDDSVSVNAGETNTADIMVSHFVPDILSPSDNVNLHNPLISWEPIGGAAKYALRISVSADLKSVPPIEIDGSITQYRPHTNEITDDTRYYWQVASVDHYGNMSQGSDVRVFFKTGTPFLTSPRNHSELLNCNSDLFWKDLKFTDTYEVRISENHGMIPFEKYTVSGNHSFHTTNLGFDKSYFWQVFALDSNAELGKGSEIYQFSLKNLTSISDIRPGTGDSDPKYFYEIDDTVFFRADDKMHGMELWAATGAKSEAFLVKDICEGECNSNPKYFTQLNGKIIFSATNGKNATELWISDGTYQGTKMLKNISTNGGSKPMYLVKMEDPEKNQDVVYFSAGDDTHGRELWKTDGSRSGTVMAANIRSDKTGIASGDPKYLTVIGQTLFFSANDGKKGRELWKLDVNGPAQVHDIYLGKKGSGPQKLTAVGNTLYFKAKDRVNGYELFKCDTMMPGTYLTTLVKNIRPGIKGSHIDHITSIFDEIYFEADDGIHGKELWRSDGTDMGTFMIADIHKGKKSAQPYGMAGFKGNIYFKAYDETFGREIFYTNGTKGDIHLLKDINRGVNGSSAAYFTFINNQFFFKANDGHNGRELWVSDGTSSGTTLFMDIWTGPESGFPFYIKAIENGKRFIFKANDGLHGNELWISDGTKKNTEMILDINFSDKAHAQNHTIENNSLVYFTALEDISGNELWTSDGTIEGTKLLKNIHPTGSSNPKDLVIFDNSVYFFATNGNNVGLWRTDGTSEDTTLICPFHTKGYIWPENLTVAGDKLFFSGPNGLSERELFVSNGDVRSISLIDIAPDGKSSDPQSLLGMNGLVYFAADDGTSGLELWRSDGTMNGTYLVKDISPDGDSTPRDLTQFSQTDFYFLAFNGQNIGLWKTDTRRDETTLVKSLDQCSGLKASNSSLFFSCRKSNQYTLWMSDGTTAQTKPLYSFTSSESAAFGANTQFSVGNYSEGNGKTFFIAHSKNSKNSESAKDQKCDLWVTDHTAKGTKILKSNVDENGSMRHEKMLVLNNRLIFPAFDTISGYELWESDGTLQGTNILFDFNPLGDSFPSALIQFDDTILFSAFHPESGFQVRLLCP